MNAHDQLERQLRASVAQQRTDRGLSFRPRVWSWSRGFSALIVATGTVVALAVAIVALVALHHSRPPSLKPSVLSMTTGRARVGPRPRDPGPTPRNVDDAAVAAVFNTAWRKDPTCRPDGGRGPGAEVSYGTPSPAMLSTLPILRRPATSADRLPANLYVHVGSRLGVLVGGEGGDAYIRYVRRVRIAEGRAFYLVPIANVGRPPLSSAAANRCYQLVVAALRAELPSVPLAERAPTRRYGDAEYALDRYNLETSTVNEGVGLIYENVTGGGSGGGGGGGVQTLESIQQGGQLGEGGGGKPPTPIMMDGIVPSGVASVTLTFPATRHHGNSLPALSAVGKVINNVFIIPIPTLLERGAWPNTAIWRSPSGNIIKTVNERPFHP
jgi:hypothetical protein